MVMELEESKDRSPSYHFQDLVETVNWKMKGADFSIIKPYHFCSLLDLDLFFGHYTRGQ